MDMQVQGRSALDRTWEKTPNKLSDTLNQHSYIQSLPMSTSLLQKTVKTPSAIRMHIEDKAESMPANRWLMQRFSLSHTVQL